MPFLRRDDSDSAALIVWGSVCLTVLRLSIEAANWLVLWYVYGRRTVAQLHLSIIRIKPRLVVSNGDVLDGLGAVHYLIGVAIWIPASILVLVALTRSFAPAWWKDASDSRHKMQPGVIGFVALLVMFFTISGLPVGSALALGGSAAALGLWWLRTCVPLRRP